MSLVPHGTCSLGIRHNRNRWEYCHICRFCTTISFRLETDSNESEPNSDLYCTNVWFIHNSTNISRVKSILSQHEAMSVSHYIPTLHLSPQSCIAHKGRRRAPGGVMPCLCYVLLQVPVSRITIMRSLDADRVWSVSYKHRDPLRYLGDVFLGLMGKCHAHFCVMDCLKHPQSNGCTESYAIIEILN